MDAFVKAGLYLGTVLLVGAGGYLHFVDTARTKVSRQFLIAVLLGFLLIATGSIFNLAFTVMNALGSRFNTAFLWEYAISTQHGKMTLIRVGLALLLVPLSLITSWKQRSSILFSIVALGFLATFSILSHATTMDGTPAFIADLIHLSSATLWVGAITFSIVSQVWKQENFTIVMKRVSNIAFVCVIVLVGTGIYTSLLHLRMIPFFVDSDLHTNLLNIKMIPFFVVSSDYGRILLAKVSVFSAILVLAVLNRWYFMPQLLTKKETFQKVLMTEVILLFTVLALTGLLTVSALPHDMTR
jgi:putative copper export protein